MGLSFLKSSCITRLQAAGSVHLWIVTKTENSKFPKKQTAKLMIDIEQSISKHIYTHLWSACCVCLPVCCAEAPPPPDVEGVRDHLFSKGWVAKASSSSSSCHHSSSHFIKPSLKEEKLREPGSDLIHWNHFVHQIQKGSSSSVAVVVVVAAADLWIVNQTQRDYLAWLVVDEEIYNFPHTYNCKKTAPRRCRFSLIVTYESTKWVIHGGNEDQNRNFCSWIGLQKLTNWIKNNLKSMKDKWRRWWRKEKFTFHAESFYTAPFSYSLLITFDYVYVCMYVYASIYMFWFSKKKR